MPRHESRIEIMFFAGLVLVVSPLVTWAFLGTHQILSLMMIGCVTAAGALIDSQFR
jgi:nitrate reductase NapE component